MTGVQDWPGRAEIVARSQQRWRRRLPLIIGLAAFGGVAGGVWGSTDDSGHRHRHHSVTTDVVAVAVAIVIAAALVAVVALVMRKRGSDRMRAAYRAPLALGLPRRDRREVARSIRRGVPSDDPTLLAVERESAQRIVSRRRSAIWILPFVVVVEVANAVFFDRSTASRVFYVVLAVVLLALWVWSLVMLRGAARLLAVPPLDQQR